MVDTIRCIPNFGIYAEPRFDSMLMETQGRAIIYAKLLLHFQYNLPQQGIKQLCYIQWYERVAPNEVDETGLVELRLVEPKNQGLQVVEPESIQRMIHVIPNFILDDVVYANHYIDVDFYQR